MTRYTVTYALQVYVDKILILLLIMSIIYMDM